MTEKRVYDTGENDFIKESIKKEKIKNLRIKMKELQLGYTNQYPKKVPNMNLVADIICKEEL